MLKDVLVANSTSLMSPCWLGLLYSLLALTNLRDSFLIFTRHFKVLVGSLGCGGG